MLKRFRINPRSVVIAWLISYLAILMVPIMVSSFIYESSKNILRSEIHRANDALLNETKELIDNELNSVKRLATELFWNTRVRDLMYSAWYNWNDGLYDTYLTAKELASYQYAYPSVKSYYIY